MNDSNASAVERLKSLSPRETEVVLLVGRGLSNKAIARKLGVSDGTIKMHLHTIFIKLRVSGRNQLVVLAGRGNRAA